MNEYPCEKCDTAGFVHGVECPRCCGHGFIPHEPSYAAARQIPERVRATLRGALLNVLRLAGHKHPVRIATELALILCAHIPERPVSRVAHFASVDHDVAADLLRAYVGTLIGARTAFAQDAQLGPRPSARQLRQARQARILVAALDAEVDLVGRRAEREGAVM